MDERRRRLEKEIALDATPEQVWEAVSTTGGLSTWFVPHETGEDGEPVADFGGGQKQGGKVLAWERGRRVVYGAPDAEPGQDSGFALEFLVEGRDGGGAVLRLVQSGFFDGDDWEAEYEGTSRGWDLFLHNLASYLEHFAGLPVSNVVAMAFTTLDGEEVWRRYHRELGVDPVVAVGDRVRLTPSGLEPVEGVVDVREHGTLGVRTEHGLYRFLGLGADAHGMVNATHYLYDADAGRPALTTAWQNWLTALVS